MSLLEIQDLDFKSTRKQVYRKLKRYKYLLNIIPIEAMPSITAAYSFIPPSTNKALNAVEACAEKNIKRKALLKERHDLMVAIHEAVTHLKPDERYIIVNKFLVDEPMLDYEIYCMLGVGKTRYHEVKNDAIIRLGFYLGIEVYLEEVTL